MQPVVKPALETAGRPKEFEEPASGDILDRGGGGGRGEGESVLIPCRGQPIGRKGRGEGATDDEAEVARAGGGDEARVDGGGELGDDVSWVFTFVGEGSASAGNE